MPDYNKNAVHSFLEEFGTKDGYQESLASLAMTLAARLDDNIQGMAVAPVAKELRATLEQLKDTKANVDLVSQALERLRSPRLSPKVDN